MSSLFAGGELGNYFFGPAVFSTLLIFTIGFACGVGASVAYYHIF